MYLKTLLKNIELFLFPENPDIRIVFENMDNISNFELYIYTLLGYRSILNVSFWASYREKSVYIFNNIFYSCVNHDL